MNSEKLKTFLIWMRNGICISFTWLIALLLLRNTVAGIEGISTLFLWQLLLFVIGGALIFTLLFSSILFRRAGFVPRLTAFLLLFGIYESICFYQFGLFQKQGSLLQWMIFAGIILVLYILSVGIFLICREKKGAEYTAALKQYQQEQMKQPEMEGEKE